MITRIRRWKDLSCERTHDKRYPHVAKDFCTAIVLSVQRGGYLFYLDLKPGYQSNFQPLTDGYWRLIECGNVFETVDENVVQI